MNLEWGGAGELLAGKKQTGTMEVEWCRQGKSTREDKHVGTGCSMAFMQGEC